MQILKRKNKGLQLATLASLGAIASLTSVDTTLAEEASPQSDRITVINPQDFAGSNFVLIESNGKYGLFDAGTNGVTDKEYKIVTDYLKKVGITKLDFLALSHLDWDHVSLVSNLDGHETKTLYDDFKVDKLYIKEPEDASTYKIASLMNQTGPEFHNYRMRVFTDIVDLAKQHGTEIQLVTENFDFDFGDFHIHFLNTAAAKEDEKDNYWPNLDSLVQLVTKVDTKGNTYRMLIANDLEGYDIPEVIDELKAIGVTELEAYELNHHGYSQDQREANWIAKEFDTPTTVVTNSEANMKQAVHTSKYKSIQETYTNGLYWRGEGTVQFDFSNLDSHGLVVKQEHATSQTQVKKNGDQKSVKTYQAEAPVTEDDLTAESPLLPVETVNDEVTEPEAKTPVEEVIEPEVETPADEVVEPEVEAPNNEVVQPDVETLVDKVVEPKVETPDNEVVKPEVETPDNEVVKPEIERPINEIDQLEVKDNNLETTVETVESEILVNKANDDKVDPSINDVIKNLVEASVDKDKPDVETTTNLVVESEVKLEPKTIDHTLVQPIAETQTKETKVEASTDEVVKTTVETPNDKLVEATIETNLENTIETSTSKIDNKDLETSNNKIVEKPIEIPTNTTNQNQVETTSNKSLKPSKQSLPNTGDQNPILSALIGLVSTTLGLLGLNHNYRKDRNKKTNS